VSPFWVSVHSLCYEQTVMLVNTLRVYIRLRFSLKLEKNFDARPVRRVPIYTVHIGWSYKITQTKNKAEVSIWGVEMFYIQVSLGPQKITVECKLWCQNSLWYVCSKSPLNHTHVLFAASCGIKWYAFYVLLLVVRSLHVAAILWAWHICRVRKAN